MFETIPITEKTLEKVFCYANETCKVNRSSLECYGYLISPIKKNDGVVYDAFLPANQLAETGKDTLNPRDVINASREIRNNGYKIMGCWQSHGHGRVFHSRDDIQNLENLLLSVSLNSNFPTYSDSLRIYGDNLRIRDKEGETAIVLPDFFGNIDENKKFLINLTNENVSFYIKPGNNDSEYNIGIKTKTIGYAYSIVVNTQGDINSKIGVLETCNCCKTNKRELKDAEIRKIRINNDISFSEDAIRDEVKRKIIVNSFWRTLLK